MKSRTLYSSYFCAAILTVSSATAECAPTKTDANEAKVQIVHEVDSYLNSITTADAKLGATIFQTSADTTFIQPRGTHYGWVAIQHGIYDFFKDTFTQRELKRVGDVRYHRYGDTAVVDFDWDFVATFRKDNTPLHTSGRESQIYHYFPKQGWRIVHVHYSGAPVTGAGQGF